jgi:hypothetical protein
MVGVTSPSLTMSAVSNTFRAYRSVHSEERAISLSLTLLLLLCQPRLARNLFSGQELSPTHASVRCRLRWRKHDRHIPEVVSIRIEPPFHVGFDRIMTKCEVF